MKRYIKILAAIVLACIITLCFAGCKSITTDTNPDDFVVVSNDRENLFFNGETYKKLPKDAKLFCIQMENHWCDLVLNVKQEGVPALLTNIFKNTADYDEHEDLFIVNYWHISKLILDSETYKPTTEYYCNELNYDVFMDALEHATIDKIGFEYENGSFILGILSESASKEIYSYIESPEKMTKEAFEKINEEYVCHVAYRMYKCDESGTLAEKLENYDIYRDNVTNTYLVDKANSTAVKLSDDTAKEIKFEYLGFNSNSSVSDPDAVG